MSNQHLFSQIPKVNIQRSSFDRTSGYKTTFDTGDLIPIFVDEVLPGDTFNLKMTAFARLATPLHPFMDNMYIDSFFFFVPNRLIWDNWEKFNGAQDAPGDSTDYLIPTTTSPASTGYLNGSLSDYFGIPTETENITHNALWHRAYNLIYNEWFRDENLQNPVTVNKGDGPDPSTDYSILKRGKRHDYFTSALPWPQKGPAVDLPLGTTAAVVNDGTQPSFTQGTDLRTLYMESGNTIPSWSISDTPTNPTQSGDIFFNNTGLVTDLTTATSATINQLRQAYAVQTLYERDARGGTRYTELVKSHFGVTSPDARLQRPEYLGGGTTPVNVNPIQQTSATESSTPQGNLAAQGTITLNNHGFTKSFTEHGVIIGLVSARADLTYQQGLNRAFSRQTRFDYFWPALANIGEQAILNQEIYAQGTSADTGVFGFQERFAEYRYKPSLITGKFRSNFAQSLDTWHLAQDFGSLPSLNNTFIVENPPVDRVIAVPSEPHFLFDSDIRLTCARPMPLYSVPGASTHF